MKDLIILSIIANTANEFTVNDRDALDAKSDAELIELVSAQHTEETARNALSVHGFDFDGYANFEENKAGFEAYQADAKAARDAKVEEIVANTEYTAEMLDGKSDDELEVINKMIDKSVDRAGTGQAPQITNTQDDEQTVSCDYS